MDQKTDSERKKLLAQAINSQVVGGARVESQGDFQAVMVRGKQVNHTLHVILSVLTCGLWALIWGTLAAAGGEKRFVVQIDEYGNTNIQR